MSLGYCVISVLKHSPYITSKEISYNYDQLFRPQCFFETSSCSYNVGDQTNAFTDCSILMTRRVTRLLRRLFIAVTNWRIFSMSLFRYVTGRRNIYSLRLSTRRFHDVPPVEINVEIIQTRMSANGTLSHVLQTRDVRPIVSRDFAELRIHWNSF